MNRHNFYVLTFYPVGEQAPPCLEQLEDAVGQYPGNVHRDALRAAVAPGAICYSTHQKECTFGLYFSAPDSGRAIGFVLHLLRLSHCNACLEVNHRPVLTQIDGHLRLDLQRFWTPELLAVVRTSRKFTRSRVLYDFPGCGICLEEGPESKWQCHFVQALVNVYRPGGRPEHIHDGWDLCERLNFDSQDERFLREFWRLSEARLRLDREIHSLADVRHFLAQAAPDLYCQRPVLPAVVIGGPPLIASAPPWIHFLFHQHGGYGCLHSQTSGVILPLQLNRSAARLDPGELLDGFEAMAEEPDHELLQRFYPALDPLTHTSGAPYHQKELEMLHQFISKCYRIPRFTLGWEALLEFEPCDPLEWFAGWEMARTDGEEPLIYGKETHRHLQDWYGAEPKCYFLWNNSD